MTRIHINLPDKFIFSTELPVRISDLNYGNHVGNDSILTLMQEARALFYLTLGFNSEVSIEGTVGQVVADAAIVYKAESFFGDTLLIEIAVLDLHKYGFDMVYRISNTITGKEVARGKTAIVCFDYAKRKMTVIPTTLQKALGVF